MAITFENKRGIPIQFKSAQFRYTMIYTLVTFVVLLFLNIYSAKSSQEIFYNSKEKSMLEKCRIAASEISSLDILNSTTVESAVANLQQTDVTRLLITDQSCKVIYDSAVPSAHEDQYFLFPEIITALEGNDVFSWQLKNGRMESHAAMPVYAYGTLTGCVYLMEQDHAQGALVATLQNSMFTITLILEIAVIIFSIAFATVYSRRLRKIMSSIRTVRTGDYSHQVNIGGNDELTTLGNEFNDLIRRLQTSENKRRQFVSDASHELKTPLASIKLLSDSIMQNQMDDDTVREFVGDIGNEAERLNRMSQKLLSLARADGVQEESCEITYIAPTVQKVTRMLSLIALEHSMQISTNLENDCPILMMEDDLYQIIFNLVENGIKYNRPGGALTISLERQDDNAIIVIRDTGVGIPEKALDHIFERFYRVDKARSRSSGGSGLGLSIVRNLVDRNRGTITVNSAVGEGTEFIITFPAFEIEEDQNEI